MSDVAASSVDFSPLSDAEYEERMARSSVEYAAEIARRDGIPIERAEEAARAQLDRLLPQGRRTSDHFFCKILERASGRAVGFVWYALLGGKSGDGAAAPPRHLFLYDIVIHESERGKGHGTATMRLLEEKARESGLSRLVLHVFGHNRRAWKLYASIGYEVADVILRKDLP